jgi:hypothetical protein
MVRLKLNFLTFMALWFLSGEMPLIRDARPEVIQTVTENFSMKGQNFCQVVINELMVDPTPVIGLPDAEWIEIHNSGNCAIHLKDWTLKVGTTLKTLPDSLLSSGEYAIICASRFMSEFNRYGKTVGLATLPALRNSGNHLALLNAADSLEDEIDYSDTWYGSSNKKNGGWSLERIDPLRFCGQAANWTASLHPDGGTPGRRNSVYASNPDNEKPEIILASAISSDGLEICFSEPMDTIRLKDRSNYFISEGPGKPAFLILKDDQTIQLFWQVPPEKNYRYILRIENLTDPCGNTLSEKEIEAGWITIARNEVVINEVLFDPLPDCKDFVEIFNNSSKNIEAGRLLLATRDKDGQLKSHISLKNMRTILKPGDYLAFTIDTNAIRACYPVPFAARFCQPGSLPALNNDSGNIIVLNDSMEILDEFTYSEEMHHPLLFNREGVSLERINPKTPTQSGENWQSASSETGFATPGYKNSQYLAGTVKHTAVTFAQEAISPNDDGYNDELLIRYETRKTGWTLNCTVYDSSGRLVCPLLKNAIAGTSGEINWNGKDRDGGRLQPGIYVVLTEFFSLEGYSERFKNAVVLTVRGK